MSSVKRFKAQSSNNKVQNQIEDNEVQIGSSNLEFKNASEKVKSKNYQLNAEELIMTKEIEKTSVLLEKENVFIKKTLEQINQNIVNIKDCLRELDKKIETIFLRKEEGEKTISKSVQSEKVKGTNQILDKKNITEDFSKESEFSNQCPKKKKKKIILDDDSTEWVSLDTQ